MRKCTKIQQYKFEGFSDSYSVCSQFWAQFRMKLNYALCAIISVVLIGSSVSFVLDSAAESVSDERIIGGATAKPGQFPHQISVRRHDEPNFNRCGGSIFSNRWVVTAARCTDDIYSSPSRSLIVVGAHHISSNSQKYNLTRIVRHPAYTSAKFWLNNISLLRTSKTIQFNSVVKAIPIRKQFLNGGENSTVSGWGYIRVGKKLIKTVRYALRQLLLYQYYYYRF